ncbi:hypothetical protein JYU20_00735 [Bacteroidales bacterium AH-315-I05]|nr:hypothetical protein [Bacteroidales bacterium AH-315-I05]
MKKLPENTKETRNAIVRFLKKCLNEDDKICVSISHQITSSGHSRYFVRILVMREYVELFKHECFAETAKMAYLNVVGHISHKVGLATGMKMRNIIVHDTVQGRKQRELRIKSTHTRSKLVAQERRTHYYRQIHHKQLTPDA